MSQPTPTTTRSRGELRAWRNAVFVIFILSGLAVATWVARIPGVRDDLGLGRDPSSVGLLILGMSVGAIIGRIINPFNNLRLKARLQSTGDDANLGASPRRPAQRPPAPQSSNLSRSLDAAPAVTLRSSA